MIIVRYINTFTAKYQQFNASKQFESSTINKQMFHFAHILINFMRKKIWNSKMLHNFISVLFYPINSLLFLISNNQCD